MLLASGCLGPGGGSSTTTTATTPGPGPAFDGDAAFALVAGLVESDDGLRPRVPGMDREGTLAWLRDAAAQPGWNVTREDFTGADVETIGYGGAQVYRDRPDLCGEEERERAAGLAFTNVVAVWDSPADATLLLAAHWDAKLEANRDAEDPHAVVPGANDGASGVGVLLQFIQHVAAGDLVPVADVRVVLFDGEDGFEDCHPVAGSTYHADSSPVPDAMVLLDMVGDADARFVRETRSVASAEWLVDLVWAHGRATGPADRFTDRACSVYDDHMPFVERGVAVVDVIDFGRGDACRFPPYWHTADDTLDKLSPAALGHVGATVWALLEDDALAAALAPEE